MLFLSIIFGCKENGVTEPEENLITISGTLTECDENGVLPSVNTEVLLDSETSQYVLQTVTDKQGKFEFLINLKDYPGDKFDIFGINVNKTDFEPINFSLWHPSDSIRTNISLQFKKNVIQ